jgi:hypothetical protein
MDDDIALKKTKVIGHGFVINDTTLIRGTGFRGNVKNEKFSEKVLREIYNTYTPKLLEILKDLAPEKIPLYDHVRMTFTLTSKDYSFPVHADNTDKLLSTVIYLKPEHNAGTILYETKKDKNPKMVEWKQNRALIFSRTDETWHAYKGDGINDRYALVYNLMSKREGEEKSDY